MNDAKPRSRDQQPMSRRERVDRASDEFEQQWKTAEDPRIEAFLIQADEGDRELLLRELIVLEMTLRDEAGRQVDPQEYQGRFAGDGQIVDSAVESFQKRNDADQSLRSTKVVRHDEDSHKEPPEASNPEKDTPKRIGRYEIIRILGRGGFATVYLARDTDLDREVALKVPRLDRFDNEAALEFFVEEARKAAQLDHRRIVRVHDVQREPGLVYIVQQYVAGGDLTQYTKSHRLPPRRIAELMIESAEAVGHAHQHGYIHLDLKPANILLDHDGNPYVADFGLALHESMQREKEGQLLGTFVYMSPAQARGEIHRLDGRSDIWSLGIILYELLTGRRPFSGKTREELVDQIEHHDPRPPRMVDPKLPRQLSRICLACLTKRATDRYSSTADLIDDLRHWLEDKPLPRDAMTGAQPDGSAEQPAAKVIPQGLRSFEAEHADFYLELLPGPHDREGLPTRVRFWKTQIERTDPDESFAVGLMYGPSGCGKSSLVKAGLIPRLSDEVLPIYVEASAADTEVRLIKSLRKRCPELPPEASLPELIAELRCNGGSRGRKVLIVLDQFEQWLHAHESREDSQLIPALRQCDGGSIQCMVLVRDDFWMSATRFMQALEVPLVEGHNSAAVDLFAADHARNVLTLFGRSYGKLPELPTEPSKQQLRFVERSVDGLADEGKVVCVRLAVFAEMTKGRPWSEESLAKVGGTEGIGVTFLEEAFSTKTAPPLHQLHQEAVRFVLEALLPKLGTKIKGQMKSYEELLKASGYQDRSADFDALLSILNSEVRLITPTEPDKLAAGVTADSTENRARYYQLTHDFLVPPLRQWLTQKQRATRRGRAKLRLDERAELWNAKPENRHLPSLAEWARIRTLTDTSKWTEPQRAMIKRAGRVHTLRWGLAISVLLVIGFTTQGIMSSIERRNLREQVKTAVASLNTSRGIILPPLASFEQFPREAVVEELRSQFADSTDSRKLPLAYALAHYDDVRLDFLLSQVEPASPDEFDNFAAALGDSGQAVLKAIDAAARVCDARAAETDEASETEMVDAWRYKVRLAMLAILLGDPTLAAEMCQVRPDPIQRTVFIDECSSWCGDLLQLSKVARTIDHVALRSAVCLAVGGVSTDHVTPEQHEVWQSLLADWHRNQPDSGTHSASGWALRQWGLPPLSREELSRGDASRDSLRQWYVNGVGLTMLRVPAQQAVLIKDGAVVQHRKIFEILQAFGKMVLGEDGEAVQVESDFLISDREVSVDLFQQFIDDPDYPADEKPKGQLQAMNVLIQKEFFDQDHPVPEKPKDWQGADTDISPTPTHPVQNVSWYDAVQFCNWLSRKEGLTPCYERTGQKEKAQIAKEVYVEYDAWRLLSEANGYRLPSEAEWDYACRAGTSTIFSCGDAEEWLDAYAVYRVDTTQPCGNKRPNAWGLFDFHGNVYEWCEDESNKNLKMFGSRAPGRACRGGCFNVNARGCRSSESGAFIPGDRYDILGFRVASVLPSQWAGAESGSR